MGYWLSPLLVISIAPVDRHRYCSFDTEVVVKLRHPLARKARFGGAWVIIALFVLATLQSATLEASAADPKRVFVLHSFGRDFAPFSEVAKRFHTDLVRQSPEPLDFYEASIFTARFQAADKEASLIQYLEDLFAAHRLDLVVTLGAPAANFVQAHRSRLFSTMPVLFASIDDRLVAPAGLKAKDAVVAVRLEIGAYIDNILRLRPETTEIAIVIGNSPHEQFWVKEMRNQFQPFEDRVKFSYLNEFPLDDILQRIANLPPNAAILYTMFAVDTAGATYPLDVAFERIRAIATVPIFSYADYNLGHGAVGGPLAPSLTLGQKTAAAALRILRGEQPSDLQIMPTGFGAPTYDWRELRKWKISESRLPPDSVVQFRAPTAWQQYQSQMILILCAMLIQGAIISWLLFERYRRRRAEVEARGRMLEVIHLNRTAAAGALSSSIAHELNQPLGAILSNAEAAELLLKEKSPDIGQLTEILGDIRQADQRAADIIQHLRKLLKKQVEIELQEFDLNDAITGAMQVLSPEAAKRGVTLNKEGVSRQLLVRADQVHLEQVILNLATNGMDAMNGSGSSDRRMTIQTVLTDRPEVEVSVADRGTGIPAEKLKHVFDTFYTTKQEGTGLGLSIARTIVETYGGRIWAENRTGGGAVFRFTLPLSESRST